MLIEIGQKAKETSYILGKMGTDLKNAGLLAAAQEILDEEDEILKANAADVAKAKERGMAPGLVDRLELNHKRIEGIVEGMRQVVGLEDPVGIQQGDRRSDPEWAEEGKYPGGCDRPDRRYEP